jgi:hypothetical protein
MKVQEGQVWGDGEYLCRVFDVSDHSVSVRYQQPTRKGDWFGRYTIDEFVSWWQFLGNSKNKNEGFEIADEGVENVKVS